MGSFFPDARVLLPSTPSLLVKGPYHPSAPIHLMHSFLKTQLDLDALFITPSRELFVKSLEDYRDTLLHYKSPTTLFSRVRMLYPPTPMHFSFLISNLEVTTVAPADRKLHDKTTLDAPPCLVVLYELSQYFLLGDEGARQQWTVSSYMNLITQTMSAMSFLSPDNVPTIVLFDSQLQNLRLPITKTPSRRVEADDSASDNRRTESVLVLVQNFFHTAAVFSRDSETAKCHLHLETGQICPQKWSWTEHDDGRAVQFVWD